MASQLNMVLFGELLQKELKKDSFPSFPHNSGTRIVGTSSSTSDWININILGYVLCIIMALVCRILSGILLVSISLVIFVIVSIILDVYIYIKKDSFPEEILRLLS